MSDGDIYHDAVVRALQKHVEIIDGKNWIQRDGTEDGVALDFTAAGISPDEIVLAYQWIERENTPALRGHNRLLA